MVQLSVPDDHSDALIALLKLTEDEGKTLDVLIEDSDKSVPAIQSVLAKETGANGANAFSALLTLLATVRKYRLDEDEVIRSLIHSAFDEESDGVGNGLPALLGNRTIKRLAKALNLRNEYERIIVDTRMLTDIRPVFPDDEISSIRAAIINHDLRLTYSNGSGETREMHFAMDARDLEKLKAQVDRALKKEKEAQALIVSGGALVLEPLAEESE